MPNTYTHSCLHCETNFDSSRPQSKYCSVRCRVAASREAAGTDDPRYVEKDLGAAYAETVTKERELTEADQETVRKLIKGKGPGVPSGWDAELPRDEHDYPPDGTSGTWGDE